MICMRIGILNTDTIKPEFATKYGQYPEMFSKILLQTDQNIKLSKYQNIKMSRYQNIKISIGK